MRLTPHVSLVGSGEFALTEIPSAHPIYDCHIYLIDGGTSMALVDAGYGSVDQIVEYARWWGLDPERIETCLITHAHHDHTRAAAEWQARFGVKILASAAAAEALERVDVRTLAYSCPEGTFTPCVADRVLADGESIAVGDLEVTAVSTPGHTDGDLTFLLDADGVRTAFVGDLFTFDGVDQVGFAYPLDASRDRPSQAESLLRLYALRPDLVLPGHAMLGLRRGWRWLGTALHHLDKAGMRLEPDGRSPDVL